MDVTLRSLKVLVVDDDPVAATLAAEVIGARGHDVEVRTSALGTTAYLMRGGFDVLVLDLEMPGLNGETLGQVAREGLERRDKRLEIILYSGASEDELKRVSEQVGARGWIDKSCGPLDMIKRFEDLTAKL